MLLFLTIVFIDLLVAAEMDILVPSFPALQDEFNLTPFLVQFVLSANGLFYAISSLFMGALGDRFGRKQVILGGLYVFIVGSLISYFAETYAIMLLGRIFQGIGAASSAVLVFVIVSDEYPKEKQAFMFSLLNGVITLGIAVAPLLGSMISIHYGWRGNIVFLFGIAAINIAMCTLFLPKKPTNQYNQDEKTTLPSVKTKFSSKKIVPNAPTPLFSFKAYAPLLRSKPFLRNTLTICLLDTCYWVFVGMSSILYVEDMGIPLTQFGYYQGSIAVAFGAACLLSPLLFKVIEPQKCLKWSLYLTFIIGLGLVFMGYFIKDKPLYISIGVCLFSIVLVFPLNIAYPKALDMHPEYKGRAGALINVGILVFTAIGLQLVSFFYGGKFFFLALFMFVCISIAFWLMHKEFQYEDGLKKKEKEYHPPSKIA